MSKTRTPSRFLHPRTKRAQKINWSKGIVNNTVITISSLIGNKDIPPHVKQDLLKAQKFLRFALKHWPTKLID